MIQNSTQPTLDQILIGLQKTFSRVNAATAERITDEHIDKARAMIVGDVQFQLSLTVVPAAPALDGAISDSFLYSNQAGEGISLTLSGIINTDIRIVEQKEIPAP